MATIRFIEDSKQHKLHLFFSDSSITPDNKYKIFRLIQSYITYSHEYLLAVRKIYVVVNHHNENNFS